MATYTELHSLFTGQSELKNKLGVAVIVAAEAIREEDIITTNHANRLLWAASAFSNPRGVAGQMFMAVLAANKTATLAAITGASDEAIQENVDAVVDLFATGA